MLAGQNVGFFVGAGISAYQGTAEEAARLLMKAVKQPANEDTFSREELKLMKRSSFGEDMSVLTRSKDTVVTAFLKRG